MGLARHARPATRLLARWEIARERTMRAIIAALLLMEQWAQFVIRGGADVVKLHA